MRRKIVCVRALCTTKRCASFLRRRSRSRGSFITRTSTFVSRASSAPAPQPECTQECTQEYPPEIDRHNYLIRPNGVRLRGHRRQSSLRFGELDAGEHTLCRRIEVRRCQGVASALGKVADEQMHVRRACKVSARLAEFAGVLISCSSLSQMPSPHRRGRSRVAELPRRPPAYVSIRPSAALRLPHACARCAR